MMKKKQWGLWITIVSLFTISTTYAQVDSSVFDELKEKGSITQETEEFSLFPETELCELAAKSWSQKEKPSYSAEYVF